MVYCYNAGAKIQIYLVILPYAHPHPEYFSSICGFGLQEGFAASSGQDDLA
jgi:hypothetical protein